MKLSDRALSFAIRMLDGQNRRVEDDKPEILHSMIVGDLAKRYGFDDNIVAACYLHDVIEQTNGLVTINDIARLFGGDVATLVMTATDPVIQDWHEKKKHKIKACKDLPFRNRVVITLDKIANLEDLRITFQKNNKVDFSLFHAGAEDQKWYYESMLEVLEDGYSHPMFDRLHNNILAVFYHRDSFLDNHYNFNSPVSKSLNARMQELGNLRNVLESPKPFIIEFTSNAREKSEGLIDVMSDFFKEGFKIKVKSESVANEFNTEFVTDYKSIDITERNLLLAAEVEAGLLSETASGQDILMLDRGLFERLIWLQRYLKNGRLSKANYDAYIKYYLIDLEAIINYVVISYSKSEAAKNKEYESTLQNCIALLSGNRILVDNDQYAQSEAARLVFENLLPIMRADSIRQLKLFLEMKKSS